MSTVFAYRVGDVAKLPDRKTTYAAAYDLTAYVAGGTGGYAIAPLQTVVIPTGLHIALPPDYVALVCCRSGHAVQGLMVTNSPGIIDSDYRGEVKVIMTFIAPLDTNPIFIPCGQRIAQLLILSADAIEHPDFYDLQCAADLPDAQSNRVGGLGSTGA